MSILPDLLERDGLVIRVIRTGDNVKINWYGVCDVRNPEILLGPFIRALSGTLHDRRVVIDFRAFDYMNSAALTPILQFIKHLDQMKITTTLQYDTSVGWQRVTYRCMKTIARTLTNLTVEDLPAQK